jgi:hypothetical protein
VDPLASEPKQEVFNEEAVTLEKETKMQDIAIENLTEQA